MAGKFWGKNMKKEIFLPENSSVPIRLSEFRDRRMGPSECFLGDCYVCESFGLLRNLPILR